MSIRAKGPLGRTLRPAALNIAMSACLAGAAATAFGQEPGADESLEAKLDRLEQVILQQQADLESQRKQLAEQYQLIQQLQAEREGGTAPSPAAPAEVEADAAPVEALAQEPAPAADESDPGMGQQAAEAEFQRRKRAGAADRAVNAQATLYDPSNTVFDPEFPGAWHLPGTTAAMKIGGYVNLSLINSLDPLETTDRFIVGSIPPEGVQNPDARSGFSVTANQTRVNLEVREQTTHGSLRAFIEGDFEGSGDAFRLRHAFGQYGQLLAGKTWSTFANLEAQPEGVDFEGINGAVIIRQSQLRFFPELGRDLSLVMALEDPRTDIVNGTGDQGFWDLAISLDRLPLASLGSWNYKVGVIARELTGTYTSADPDVPATGPEELPVDDAIGWGITTSGRKAFSRLGDNDFLLWQVTYGEGIGHYLNDLNTIGGGDAVFDPQGQLQPLPVFAGYLSFQHKWAKTSRWVRNWPGLLRSNVTVSWVDIDTFDFQDGGDYAQTLRFSINALYFPTQNVRMGVEYLWGQRENKDGSKGSANQVQFSMRYNF